MEALQQLAEIYFVDDGLSVGGAATVSGDATVVGDLNVNGGDIKTNQTTFNLLNSKVTTLNLGGDPWPIYLEPKKNVGIPDGKKITVSSNNKGVRVNLKPGDMLVYRGMELEHWREEFQGNDCCQVFLHYNDQKSENADQNVNDRRPHLGLPAWFKK